MKILCLLAGDKSVKSLNIVNDIVQKIDDTELFVGSFPSDPWEEDFFTKIKEISNDESITFIELRKIDKEWWDDFNSKNKIDIILAMGWRYLLHKYIIDDLLGGAFAIHDSLLPKYRGFAPTVWAIINGEKEVGATLFSINEGTDSGPIIDQISIKISEDIYISEIVEKMNHVYINLLKNNLNNIISNNFQTYIQDESKATYTCKRQPKDGLIDWQDSAKDIQNKIRALSHPYPGSFTYLKQKKLYIWESYISKSFFVSGSIPGRVIDLSKQNEVGISTGSGVIYLQKVQLENKAIVSAYDLLKSPNETLG